MALTLVQDARQQDSGRWKWSLRLVGEDDELDQVEYVQYTLHPSFRNPVRRIDDRTSRFRLDSSGWGEFVIQADVRMKDGTSAHLEHYLELRSPLQGAERVNGRRQRDRTVFISYGVADALIAHELRSALEAYGLDPSTADDVSIGEPWRDKIESLIQHASGVILIASERPSRFTLFEAGMAEMHKKPTVTIIVGSDARPPSWAADSYWFRINDPSEFKTQAKSIAEVVVQKL